MSAPAPFFFFLQFRRVDLGSVRFLPGFSLDKVPQNLDVIVIGSGIGGLTAGATLAKAGKKVLVLEQHDQAGGCCHTYVEKGFEFDVGEKTSFIY